MTGDVVVVTVTETMATTTDSNGQQSYVVAVSSMTLGQAMFLSR